MHNYIIVLDYLHLACFVYPQSKKVFYMKYKVVWFRICDVAFDPLQTVPPQHHHLASFPGSLLKNGGRREPGNIREKSC